MLNPASLQTELAADKKNADRKQKALVSLQSNLEMSWEDKLVVKMRELMDAMRQASEGSITRQVQEFIEQIREINA
jgi:hypothetical protein